jgi:hypothetical protein
MHQRIAAGADERFQDILLMSLNHQNRGRANLSDKAQWACKCFFDGRIQHVYDYALEAS